MASPFPPEHPTHHWVRIEDVDLDFILKFDPDRERSASRAQLVEVLLEIQDIIEDGLETE